MGKSYLDNYEDGNEVDKKIICISTISKNKKVNFGFQNLYITVGKEYHVIYEWKDTYGVINDYGRIAHFNKELFNTKEELRDNKINDLLK